MVLERYRTGAGRVFTPFALALGRLGLTQNGISVVSLLFALVAGGVFYLATPQDAWLLLVAAAFVSLNGLFDAFDGALARSQNAQSKQGDYLDHVIDRYADVAILTGVALGGVADVRLGLLALVGVFLTSYMGTQAQALGLGRMYGGLLGRADRMVLLIGAPVVEYALLALAVPLPVVGGIAFGALNVTLLYFAVVGNVTALQRFASGWQALARAGP